MTLVPRRADGKPRYQGLAAMGAYAEHGIQLAEEAAEMQKETNRLLKELSDRVKMLEETVGKIPGWYIPVSIPGTVNPLPWTYTIAYTSSNDNNSTEAG